VGTDLLISLFDYLSLSSSLLWLSVFSLPLCLKPSWKPSLRSWLTSRRDRAHCDLPHLPSRFLAHQPLLPWALPSPLPMIRLSSLKPSLLTSLPPSPQFLFPTLTRLNLLQRTRTSPFSSRATVPSPSQARLRISLAILGPCSAASLTLKPLLR
jgi:hypothetical protein